MTHPTHHHPLFAHGRKAAVDPTDTNPARPEVAGHLKLAWLHRRAASWSRPGLCRRHMAKARRHEQRALALAAAWLAQHPERREA